MFPLLELLASVEMQLIFGIASGVLSVFAFLPYILDTIARRTEPQRASWLIWAVLGSIAFMSQVFEGATSSLWFAGVQVASTIIILVLSIWVGTGKFLGKSDYMILVLHRFLHSFTVQQASASHPVTLPSDALPPEQPGGIRKYGGTALMLADCLQAQLVCTHGDMHSNQSGTVTFGFCETRPIPTGKIFRNATLIDQAIN